MADSSPLRFEPQRMCTMLQAYLALLRWLRIPQNHMEERRRRRLSRRARTVRLQLEALEERLAPATATWTGNGTTNNWSQAANWSTNTVPGAADTVVFDSTSGKNATVDSSFAGS